MIDMDMISLIFCFSFLTRANPRRKVALLSSELDYVLEKKKAFITYKKAF